MTRLRWRWESGGWDWLRHCRQHTTEDRWWRPFFQLEIGLFFIWPGGVFLVLSNTHQSMHFCNLSCLHLIKMWVSQGSAFSLAFTTGSPEPKTMHDIQSAFPEEWLNNQMDGIPGIPSKSNCLLADEDRKSLFPVRLEQKSHLWQPTSEMEFHLTGDPEVYLGLIILERVQGCCPHHSRGLKKPQ